MSGNLDAPEGGFDAIMQAIMCQVNFCHIFLSLTCFKPSDKALFFQQKNKDTFFLFLHESICCSTH